ncbi:MAG: four helix bundle protein [Patescibacteria group bacterium]
MDFDLEDRTLKFAKNCLDLCKQLQKDVISLELVKQFVRACCSVGANYREANDTITKKDFLHKIAICRRESKESKYWLELLLHTNPNFKLQIEPLIDESHQLARIFASIGAKKK